VKKGIVLRGNVVVVAVTTGTEWYGDATHSLRSHRRCTNPTCDTLLLTLTLTVAPRIYMDVNGTR